VNDLLDLSRIEAGRIEFEFVSLDLSEVLDQVQSRMSSLVAQKELEFSVVPPETGVTIRADRKYLDQVLFNLVGNAIKFTEAGGVIVHGAIHNGRQAVVSVTDTGCGIDSEDLPRIFDRFEMIGSRRRSQEGTGLGLAISKKLVEMMGGSIWVESTPGNGSTFHFTLPLTQDFKEDNDAESNDR
ncbi:MAG: ATP-binding protein, partial [Desulfobacterales bacterium]|nr:ATP-binding protein [Desulfobacterales bacterium]